ncbi:hypothetical protein SISSUDRAFT_1029870 [Sistotremastrum suecicum HHB10207 ss-3]|uniref:Uncharacterized protein n=1 Tax=Sistotremastrum suecicum HHB10207 ss-3 TaxID=1314776 RepID=A0A166I2J9_9AGAM|nr:hypothetical protein SISSUDRAFT_1029870 [Sistotremastrum suecicum HHB10207 ss-3]
MTRSSSAQVKLAAVGGNRGRSIGSLWNNRPSSGTLQFISRDPLPNRIIIFNNRREMATDILVPTTKITHEKPSEHVAVLPAVGHPGELPFPDGVRHALVIDCGDMEALQSKDDEFLTKIRRFVEEQDSQDVDFVRIQGTHPGDLPNESTWKALDGLRPRHLELRAGWDETVDTAPLDSLDTPWPLESISIMGAAQNEPVITKHFWSISSLTFYYSFQTPIELPAGYIPQVPSALRHFIAIGNDPCDMVAQWRNTSMSSITAGLETLRLESNNGCDFRKKDGYENFARFLETCTSVKSLELTLVETPILRLSDDPERDQHLRDQVRYLIDLPKYLPPNLERLKFRSIPESARHLDVWLRCAKDTHWLPHLKSISLRFDMAVRDPDQGEERPLTPSRSEATELLERIYQELAVRDPSVQVL